MKQEEYRECMRPYMTGSMTREERSQSMCIGAKLCTGKAKTKAEASAICSQPRPPKPPRRTSKAGCLSRIDTIASCLTGRLGSAPATPEALKDALVGCVCGAKKTKSQKAMENLSPGQLEALKVIAQIKAAYGTA